VVASFRPDVIVLQAGVDAHWRDPLARLALTGDGLDALFVRVIELSERWCGGRMVVTGGGGYDAWRSVPRAWARLWGRLAQRELPDDLPEAWRSHWAERLGATLPTTLGERDRPALDPLVTERAASHALATARRVGQRPVTLLARDAPEPAAPVDCRISPAHARHVRGDTMRIAFIGLGTMGGPMAARLLDAGFDLCVHNRTREREVALAERGAHRAPRPARRPRAPT
jgi:hypothetical protein